jgi:H+-transporting ATPase
MKHKRNASSNSHANPSGQADSSLADLSTEDLSSRLDASSDGLGQAEAEHRLARFGPNELPEKKVNPVLKFLSYFWGPIPVMIMVAVVLSAILRHWPDVGVILALLILNAVVGFREEYQAGNAIAALKAKLALQARAKRDGRWLAIPARELVPGDVVRLRLGDIVPADARLIEGSPLEVDQSALTGESLPVERKEGGNLYSGSIIRRGEADALVYATGSGTFYGKTAELVEAAQTRSHFQLAVLRIANYLIAVAVALAVLILAAGIVRGDGALTVLQFALVLTIAAVPVAMPAVLSVTMALGARKLAASQAIVTRLAAVEELAGIDILCSDKTGTLTQNRLEAGEPFALDPSNSDDVLCWARLASRAEDKDPIDMAVLGPKAHSDAADGYQVIAFQPFDPVNKRTEATVQGGGGSAFRVSKGAPQVILALDDGADQIRAEVEHAVGEFASRGYRSLGVARTDTSGRWRFAGVIPLFDPVRDDSRETLESANQMGIDVKMVTGDQIAIAREVARTLGMGTDIMDAGVLGSGGQSEQLAEMVESVDGFAQVFPEHKYRIVEALQERGHIVGMTGDGVNDAPALKKADAGVAVSGATDAARAAADIVLLMPGLSVIVEAVKESRRIFHRMTNYAVYRIAETVALLGFLTFAILAFHTYPVTAIMIVLLAILNDGAILSIAYDNARSSHSPAAWNMPLVIGIATTVGAAAMLRSIGIFLVGKFALNLDTDVLKTLLYLTLSVGGHLTLFVARTRGPFWSVRPAPILLAAVVGTQIMATVIALFGFLMTPLPLKYVALVWGYCLFVFPLQDAVKLLAYQVLGKRLGAGGHASSAEPEGALLNP